MQIHDGWWLLVYPGFVWDGATKFPDFDWIKTPSTIHDILHQLIALGVLPESDNPLIDKELEYAIDNNVGKRWLLKIRGWYVRIATGLVSEKRSARPYRTIQLPALDGELTLGELYAHYPQFAASHRPPNWLSDAGRRGQEPTGPAGV